MMAYRAKVEQAQRDALLSTFDATGDYSAAIASFERAGRRERRRQDRAAQHAAQERAER